MILTSNPHYQKNNKNNLLLINLLFNLILNQNKYLLIFQK